MECADTDICLQYIVTLLERKDILSVCVIIISIFITLSFILLLLIVVHLICSVTSSRGRAWFVKRNAAALLVVDQDEI